MQRFVGLRQGNFNLIRKYLRAEIEPKTDSDQLKVLQLSARHKESEPPVSFFCLQLIHMCSSCLHMGLIHMCSSCLHGRPQVESPQRFVLHSFSVEEHFNLTADQFKCIDAPIVLHVCALQMFYGRSRGLWD